MFDMYGGHVEIEFTSANGAVRSLSDLFKTGSMANKHQTTQFVSSVSIRRTILRFLEIDIILSPTFEKAVLLLQDPNLPIGLGMGGGNKFPSSETVKKDPETATEAFTKFSFNKVQVQLHFGGKKSGFFTAVLMVPEFNISADEITIKVKGVGMTFPKSKEAALKAYDQQTRLELIKKYLPVGSKVITYDEDKKLAENLGKLETMVSTGTNLEEMRKLLDKSGCRIYEIGTASKDDPTTYEIVSSSFSRRKPSGYKLVLWGQIDPNNNVFPILEMTTSLSNYVSGQMIRSVKAYNTSKKTYDANTASPTETPSKFNQTMNSPNGTGVGASLEGDSKIQKVSVPSRGEKFGTSMIEAFEGVFDYLTSKALQYEIKTIGIVDLKPGQQIQVDVAGVGPLSGFYDLLEVNHEFGADGVFTRLTLARTVGLAKLVDNAVEAVQNKVIPGQNPVPPGSNAKSSNKIL